MSQPDSMTGRLPTFPLFLTTGTGGARRGSWRARAGGVAMLYVAGGWTVFALALPSVNWLAVILTGRVPRWSFRLTTAMLRAGGAHMAAASGLSPFAWLYVANRPGFPVQLDITPPERSSRLLALGRLPLILPAMYGFIFVALGWPVVWLIDVSYDLRRQPSPSWVDEYQEGYIRWLLRLLAYAALLRDEYPPYSFRQDAPASRNRVAALTVVAAPVYCAFAGIAYVIVPALGGSWPLSKRPEPRLVQRADGTLGIQHPDGSFEWNRGWSSPDPHGGSIGHDFGQDVFEN